MNILQQQTDMDRVVKWKEFNMRGERGSGRENRDSHRHRGQSRRFSSSPDARYIGGERVPSRVPPHGGDRGEWTDVRPRRRKAFEQSDGQRDRFHEGYRRGRGWVDHHRRRSRVRVQPGADLRLSDAEDSEFFEPPVQSYDGRAVLQYSRPGRSTGQRFRAGTAVHQRRLSSRELHHHKRARSAAGRGSFRNREDNRRLLARRVREDVDGSSRGEGGRGRQLFRAAYQTPAARMVGADFIGSRRTQQSLQQRDVTAHVTSGTGKPSFVSFYFTNVPDDISYVSLRQGFEVCGILEDVYLAKKQNVNGGVFGFVRYGRVMNVEKLLKALNNVWFGDWRVVAKVASFDRFGNQKHGVGAKVEGDKHEEGRGVHIVREHFIRNVSGVDAEAIVRGKREPEVVDGTISKVGVVEHERDGRKSQHVEDKLQQVFVPKYSSTVKDLAWAVKGVVVSVLNGDAIPVLQRRIFDAGFVNLVIIPLGADKVFLRSLDDVDVTVALSEASEFFHNFFSKPVRWNKDTLVRERGAWVRIYGVPLHAWNFEFFKLCVYDCGRLLKVDDITLDRDRFDYARVLVSTSSLDIIKSVANVMVDGVLFEFKIIEEWGFAVGEDACLFDDEESHVDDRSDMPADLDNGIDDGDVDGLLKSLAAEWKKEEEIRHMSPSPVSAEVKAPTVTPTHVTSAPVEDPSLVSSTESKLAQVFEGVRKDDRQSRKSLFDDKKVIRRTSSCPPGREGATASGPWSLEWTKRHKSVSMGAAPKLKTKVPVHSTSVKRVTKRKGGGYLRHCALNLKCIARLSDCDRREVLRALRRTSRQRKAGSGAPKVQVHSQTVSSKGTSQTSVNKEWNNWLVLHGNDKVTSEDVCEIGRTVGLKFNGDKNNMFDALSGVGRKTREGGGGGV